MRQDAARCYSHASMLTGSPSTLECLFHSIPGSEKAFFVIIQKAVAAWDSAPGNRIMVSLLLPGPMEMDQWLKEVQARHVWDKIEPVWTKSSTESGPNNPRVSHMMRCLDVSFYMSTRKNPGGWRTPIGEKTGDGSNSNGRTVRLGLRNKPLRGSRVNGSARSISMDWISLMP